MTEGLKAPVPGSSDPLRRFAPPPLGHQGEALGRFVRWQRSGNMTQRTRDARPYGLNRRSVRFRRRSVGADASSAPNPPRQHEPYAKKHPAGDSRAGCWRQRVEKSIFAPLSPFLQLQKVAKTTLLNAQGALRPLHPSPATLSQQSQRGFLTFSHQHPARGNPAPGAGDSLKFHGLRGLLEELAQLLGEFTAAL